MSSQPPPGHGDLGPELRQLAQTILDRIDPAVRSMAALAAARSGDEPGKCQQLWCPFCALAAVATGEEHPLLTVIAEHSVGLLTVVRAVLEDSGAAGRQPDTDPDQPPPDPPEVPPPGNGRYQHIPITIEE
jgi:hypothetical protein